MKPKHEVLQEFSAILSKHDPMKVGNDPHEYEAEALSILSRFTESGIQLTNERAAIQVSNGIVKQCFEFWFDDVRDVGYDNVVRELVGSFRSSFIENDVVEERHVSNVTIGE